MNNQSVWFFEDSISTEEVMSGWVGFLNSFIGGDKVINIVLEAMDFVLLKFF